MARLLLKASRPRSVETHVEGLFCRSLTISPRKIIDCIIFCVFVVRVYLLKSCWFIDLVVRVDKSQETAVREEVFDREENKNRLRRRSEKRFRTGILLKHLARSRFPEDETDWIKIGVVLVYNDIIRDGCFRISR